MNNPRQGYTHFNPRSPHGERPCVELAEVADTDISTHAPRTGSDGNVQAFGEARVISTHAPRTGSDLAGKRGEETSILFQPTLPARGATQVVDVGVDNAVISTHAPRTGSDGR